MASRTTPFRILQKRAYSNAATASTPQTSPFSPRHFLSTADLSSTELTTLVRNAHAHKQSIKAGAMPKSLLGALSGKNIALMFNKRSTRTRVSSESAITMLQGHTMFLGKDDIQLGVNESLKDTAIVISSMVAAMVARVAAHADVADLATHSTVPVINALSDDFHPLQAIADCLTIYESFASNRTNARSSVPGLGLEGLKLAWVGDANNVLFDLAIASGKLGMDMAVATPNGYEIPHQMRENIVKGRGDARTQGSFTESQVPEEAVSDADVIVTDTWVSMGQEAEQQKRLAAFKGFQVTFDLAKRGKAKPGWKFMHCLPRHAEEVSDEVFYSPARSLVFPEAENRLWAMLAVLEAFVVNHGKII
ncbi:uncharacterized protein KY384_006870 [Bacidia gigantensis]|uniref:uncharacterized protein n=1 Tax=Bacidia gigantensis TaxID=2732470 RepID=UPI001D03F10B|nr:uncharacterized protein KY384_006870 [Bacidia gigantensis]KAG8527954.1 hypothetical protein KY384_006870 [Bacidia gigantensis]